MSDVASRSSPSGRGRRRIGDGGGNPGFALQMRSQIMAHARRWGHGIRTPCPHRRARTCTSEYASMRIHSRMSAALASQGAMSAAAAQRSHRPACAASMSFAACAGSRPTGATATHGAGMDLPAFVPIGMSTAKEREGEFRMADERRSAHPHASAPARRRQDARSARAPACGRTGNRQGRAQRWARWIRRAALAASPCAWGMGDAWRMLLAEKRLIHDRRIGAGRT